MLNSVALWITVRKRIDPNTAHVCVRLASAAGTAAAVAAAATSTSLRDVTASRATRSEKSINIRSRVALIRCNFRAPQRTAAAAETRVRSDVVCDAARDAVYDVGVTLVGRSSRVLGGSFFFLGKSQQTFINNISKLQCV